MARYFKKFSRHESSWCFWILNVWSKQFLGGTLLPFRCFPSVIFLWSQVGSWMKDVANSGWCQTQGLITSQKGMSMRLCRDALGVNHWLKTPSYMSWSPILRFASTCTISGLRDFADLAILQVWLHWCHSVLHVFCSVQQGNETRIAVLNVQRRCSNLLAFICNTSQRSCFCQSFDPEETHISPLRAVMFARLKVVTEILTFKANVVVLQSCLVQVKAYERWENHPKDMEKCENMWMNHVRMWVWWVQRLVTESGLKSVRGGVGCLSVVASQHSWDHFCRAETEMVI